MLNNKKEIFAISLMILTVVLAVLISLPKDNLSSGEKLKIGASDGIPSILVNELVKRYGENNIEYKEVETYSFQDC